MQEKYSDKTDEELEIIRNNRSIGTSENFHASNEIIFRRINKTISEFQKFIKDLSDQADKSTQRLIKLSEQAENQSKALIRLTAVLNWLTGALVVLTVIIVIDIISQRLSEFFPSISHSNSTSTQFDIKNNNPNQTNDNKTQKNNANNIINHKKDTN